MRVCYLGGPMDGTVEDLKFASPIIMVPTPVEKEPTLRPTWTHIRYDQVDGQTWKFTCFTPVMPEWAEVTVVTDDESAGG